jgi:hypothetical protein
VLDILLNTNAEKSKVDGSGDIWGHSHCHAIVVFTKSSHTESVGIQCSRFNFVFLRRLPIKNLIYLSHHSHSCYMTRVTLSQDRLLMCLFIFVITFVCYKIVS